MDKFINAEAFKRKLIDEKNFYPAIVARALEEMPAADVVEVKCRCKDCKYYRSYGRTSLVFEGKNIKAGWCYLRGKTDEEHRMLPFDFCSYGEKRSE